MLLFSITCSTLLWSVVNCNETIKPIAVGFDRNFTAMAINFQAKYVDKGYVKWQKLHESEPEDLEGVCERYALMLSKKIRPNMEVEATRSYHNIYYLMEHTENGTAEIDTLACLVKFMHKNGTESSRMTYYLTEGHEPDSAFRFSLVQTNIVLTRFITNVWSKEPTSSDQAKATQVTT